MEADSRLMSHPLAALWHAEPLTALGLAMGVVGMVVGVALAPSEGPWWLGWVISGGGLVLLTAMPWRPLPAAAAYLFGWVIVLALVPSHAGVLLVTSLGFLLLVSRLLPVGTTAILAGVFYSTHLIEVITLQAGEKVFFTNLLYGILVIPVGVLWRRRVQERRVEGVRAAARLEAMRTDIARQMHDLVAYSMSHTALRAQHAAHNPNHTPQARTEFAAIASNATDALHELRLLLRTLRHTTPTTQDIATTTGLGGVVTNLPAAIQAIADDITAAGFTLTYRCLGNTTPTRLQATTMSRVAREMGANIIRHAAPNAPVTLTLTLNPNIIRLVTTNKTTTHKTTHLPTSGTGTTGMREHLAPLNGTLTTLNENNSWITTATIPTNNQPTPPTTPKEAR
ncbi:histidine kinase [Actinomyces trachealis]|uniref:histidine kinase n=1 Tax=Actinomyces trachealis TaxID=2763540 RepID=UPI0018C6188C|nr:histidine kinase [Actinomyces trachealis]